MTEAEWLACSDPDPMLVHLQDKASERKLRLLCCACVRRIWYRLAHTEASRRAVEVAEEFAEGKVTEQDMVAAGLEADRATRAASKHKEKNACRAAEWCVSGTMDALSITRSVAWGATYASRKAKNVERAAQVCLIHDIFGPFHSIAAGPSWLAWNNGIVAKMAQSIHTARAFDGLPVLADALEEAGCTNADILAHCRRPGEHVRGCWAVDLLLGKQ